MSNTVNVVDSIMGSGKTTAMIRYINESSPDRRFIFCTPYLEQVERIRANCIGRNFVEPSDKAVTKLTSIKLLLRRRQNIATTHALFMLLDNEARELISEGKYTLIVDEAMDIFGMLDIAPLDSELLCEHLCSEDESGRLHWEAPDYYGLFDSFRAEIESGAIYRCGPVTLIRMANIDTFAAFDEVFLLTYLFDGQIHRVFFDVNGWAYQKWYVEGHDIDT